MKAYYRVKGSYKDGRNKVVIEFQKWSKIKSKTLPKPEILLALLEEKQDRLKKLKSTHKKRQLKAIH